MKQATNKIIIDVLGKASGKLVKQITFNPNIKTFKSLLRLLEAHQLPIASSCNGQGECLKCIDSRGLITCNIQLDKLEHHLQKIAEYHYQIEFDYL